MADYQVTCVTKTGTIHETITRLGGPAFWPWAKQDVIAFILNRQHSFYTLDVQGRADVQVVNGATGQYLRTYKTADRRTICCRSAAVAERQGGATGRPNLSTRNLLPRDERACATADVAAMRRTDGSA